MMSDITSIGNSRVKRAFKLRESRERRKEKIFPVDGIREILRAREAGFRLQELFVLAEDEKSTGRFDGCSVFDRHWRSRTASFIQDFQDGGKALPFSGIEFLKRLSDEKIPVWTVSQTVYDKLSFGDRSEGLVAIMESKTCSFSELEVRLPRNPLLGVVEGVEKPGNVGAVFRSADGAGVDGIILASPETDLFNPNTIRASLGTVFRIPTVLATSEEVIKWLIKRKYQIVTAMCADAVDYTSPDYTEPTAIVLGSEADGLTPLWSNSTFQTRCHPVKIPMLGIADSLNISSAAAILFYEARRQRSRGEIR